MVCSLSVKAISATPLAQSGSNTAETNIPAEIGTGLADVKAFAAVFVTTLQNILAGIANAAQYIPAPQADLNALATATSNLNASFGSVAASVAQAAASIAGVTTGSVGLAQNANDIVSHLLALVASFYERNSPNYKVVASLKEVQSSIRSFSGPSADETNVSAENGTSLTDVKALADVFATALQRILAGITKAAQLTPGISQATLDGLASASSGLEAAYGSVTAAMTQIAADFAGVTTGSAGLVQSCNDIVSNLLDVIASFHQHGTANNELVVSLKKVQSQIRSFLAWTLLNFDDIELYPFILWRNPHELILILLDIKNK